MEGMEHLVEVERESLQLFETIKIATKRRSQLLRTLPNFTKIVSLLERMNKEEQWFKKKNLKNLKFIESLQSKIQQSNVNENSLYTSSDLTEQTSPYTSYVVDNSLTLPNLMNDDSPYQTSFSLEKSSFQETDNQLKDQVMSDSEGEDKEVKDKVKEKKGLSNWDLQLVKFIKHKKENPNDDSYHSITQLADHFKNAAETLGRMIISESHLSQEEKKVKILNVGGVAGGSKYKAHGLFFKYPMDTKITKSNIWLYGGNQANNILASKASNHDLKGFSYMMAADPTNMFNYPLFSLFDFQGFRLVVMTELPLSEEQTICYGSSDAGHTMHCDEEVHKKLGEISAKLNLQEHRVTKHKIQTHLCGDIEIHKFQNEDKELLYVLDTARIFPPEYSTGNDASSIFYKLLRPEFVASYKVPLVSDALSGWMSDDLTQHINEDIKEASFFLKERVIEFSSNLHQNNQYQLKRLIKSSKLRIDDINPDQNYITDAIIEKLHENGINTRYLGLIIHCVANNTKEVEDSKNHTLHYLITLLLARCLKNSWKEKIREESNKERVHDTCLKYSLQFLNEGISIKQNSKSNFWEVIKKELLTSFGSVTQKDSLETIITNNLQFVLFKYLILYFVKICGIVLNKYTVISVQKDLVFEFAQADISRFVPILKIQPVLNYYSGLYFYQKANSIEQSLIQTRFNYFSTAGNKFLSIINIGFKSTQKLCAKSLLEALTLNLKFSCDIYLLEDIFSQFLQKPNLSNKQYFKYYVKFLLCLHLKTLKKTNKKNSDNENLFQEKINQTIEQGVKDKSFRKSSLLFKSLNLLQQSKILGFHYNIEDDRWERYDYLRNQERLTKKLKKYENTRFSFLTRSHQMKSTFSENEEFRDDLISLIFSSKYWNISPSEKMTFFHHLFELKNYVQVSKKIDQKDLQEYWDILLVSPITNTLFSNIDTYHYLIQNSVKDPNFQEIIMKPDYNKDKTNLIQSFFLKEFCDILKENDIDFENIRDKDGNSFLHFWAETYCDVASRSIIRVETRLNYNVKFLTNIDLEFLNCSGCNLRKLQDYKEYYIQQFYLIITNPYPNTELMQFLLESMNPNLTNNDKSTPLHKACENNFSSIIEMLLSSKADIEAQQKDQQTPLCVACEKGHASVVEILLSNKANIEAQQINQCTPLHIASQNGHASVVEILLSNKANIEAQQINHCTPLYIASQNGHASVVEILLSNKANIESEEINHYTPLHIASVNGHSSVVKLLLFHNAQIIPRVESFLISHLSIVEEIFPNYPLTSINLFKFLCVLAYTKSLSPSHSSILKKLLVIDKNIEAPKIRVLMNIIVYLIQNDMTSHLSDIDLEELVNSIEKLFPDVVEITDWLPWLKSYISGNPFQMRGNVFLVNNNTCRMDITPNGFQCKSYVAFNSVVSNKYVTKGKWYFEVYLKTGGIFQIGYVTPQFKSDPLGLGVGDDEFSWGIDLKRNMKWHHGESIPFGGDLKWQVNGVVQCFLDLDECKMKFKYGNFQEVAFENFNKENGLSPAVSAHIGQEFKINFGGEPFKFPPPEDYHPFNHEEQ